MKDIHVGFDYIFKMKVSFMHLINGYTVVTWFLEVVMGLTTSPLVEPNPSTQVDNFEVWVIEPQLLLIESRKSVQNDMTLGLEEID